MGPGSALGRVGACAHAHMAACILVRAGETGWVSEPKVPCQEQIGNRQELIARA